MNTESSSQPCSSSPISIRFGSVERVAIGKPKHFNQDYFAYDTEAVIDVGINRDEDGKLCGDVDYEDVKDYVEAITPVPGGVGPMTVAELMKNVVQAWKSNK